MSKRTITKLGRMYEAVMEKGKHVATIRRPETLPAKEKEKVMIEYKGYEFPVFMSDGQIINKRKAFERFTKTK